MTTATIQSQKLATNWVTSLFEIDFTSIGGSAKVHLSDGMERNSLVTGFEVMQVNWFGSLTTFEHIEIELSGSRSDLTGNISEPTLSIAADLPSTPAAKALAISVFAVATGAPTV